MLTDRPNHPFPIRSDSRREVYGHDGTVPRSPIHRKEAYREVNFHIRNRVETASNGRLGTRGGGGFIGSQEFWTAISPPGDFEEIWVAWPVVSICRHLGNASCFPTLTGPDPCALGGSALPSSCECSELLVLLADVEFDWDDGQKRPWTA